MPANERIQSTGGPHREGGSSHPSVEGTCAHDRSTLEFAAYMEARRRAVLAVIEAFFDEVAEYTEDEWPQLLASVFATLKLNPERPPFFEAWVLACEAHPPPDEWLPRNERERESLAARGYVPMLRKRAGQDEGLLAFMYRVFSEAYGEGV